MKWTTSISDAYKKLEYYYINKKDGFYSYLFKAIEKADSENKEKLRKVFPELVKAFDDYKSKNINFDLERSKEIVKLYKEEDDGEVD